MWNPPLDSSPVVFRCPVMLVVGDQAPYEDAAVSFSTSFNSFKHFYSGIAAKNCFSSIWPLGGVQQQNGPNDDLIPKGNFRVFITFFAPFASAVFKHLSSLSSSDGWCWRSTSADSGNIRFKHFLCKYSLIFTRLVKYVWMWLDLKNRWISQILKLLLLVYWSQRGFILKNLLIPQINEYLHCWLKKGTSLACF